MMRGIKICEPGGLQSLRVTHLPDPGEPGADEIRVRLCAASINYRDYRICSGPAPAHYGMVPLADGAGIVDAVGTDVTEFAVGDRVVTTFMPGWQDGPPQPHYMDVLPGQNVDGFACEYAVRPAAWFTPAPSGWSHVEAATLPTAALTAWRALIEDGKLEPDEVVLTLGSGGVSIFAFQFAQMMGARAMVTSSSAEKIERLLSLGVDAAINYRTSPEWEQDVLALTDGRGADHILETVGAGTIDQSIAAACYGGRISLIGSLTGHPTSVSIAQVMYKHLRLQGIVVGSRSQQIRMIEALNRSSVRPVIDAVFPLHSLAEAFHHEKAGHHIGKICIAISED